MKTIIALACVLAGCNAITNPPITGTTPPAIDCPNTMCSGKTDGNYAIGSYKNYFTQCIGGMAYCCLLYTSPSPRDS